MRDTKNKYSKTISINEEKVKARQLVRGLEVEFETLNKGKQKAVCTLPAENFEIEKEIALRAEKENIIQNCYEKESGKYYEYENLHHTFLTENERTLNYYNTKMDPNGVVNFDRFTGPMFIWRDYCGVAKESLIKESTEPCAPNSVVVVTFYAQSGRNCDTLPWEIRDGNCNYKNNLEPYLEKRFAEKGWLRLWAHHYRTSSDMIMMAFTNTKKAQKFFKPNEN